MPQKLGQHFLKNKAVIAKIIAALDLCADDRVIEIGPGKGALTLPLAETCRAKQCSVTAIEKDAQLVGELKDLSIAGLEIIQGDALKEIKNQISNIKNKEGFKIVGNIPYYITGKLLRTISELETKPSLTVLMIQKEVAERLTAKSGNMNLLAAATQIWADVSIIAHLNPHDFDPMPKVDSAVVRLESRIMYHESWDEERYYKLIHTAFKQPRKTLLNNLAEGFDRPKDEVLPILQRLGFNEKTRGQELDIAQLAALSKIYLQLK